MVAASALFVWYSSSLVAKKKTGYWYNSNSIVADRAPICVQRMQNEALTTFHFPKFQSLYSASLQHESLSKHVVVCWGKPLPSGEMSFPLWECNNIENPLSMR